MSLGHRVVSLFGSSPRYAEVYDLLRQAGENTARATALLDDVMSAWPESSSAPLDARATHQLASQIDDVVDLSEEVVDFLWLYRVEAPTDHAIELTGILRAAGAEVAAALAQLQDAKALQPHLAEIDGLEHEGDRVERAALVTLFDGGIAPIVVIRWKDIYERLEAAIDACDRVAMSLRETRPYLFE